MAGRTNEAKFGWMEGQAFFCEEFTDFAGNAEFGFDLRAPVFLDDAELLEGGLQDAGEALFVEAEELEAEKLAVQLVWGTGIRVAIVFDGEETGFERLDAIEAPLGIGHGLGELGFKCAIGLEVGVEIFGEEAVGFGVFGGEKDEVTGQAVAEGVEAGGAFAGTGAGASGMLRVLAVSDETEGSVGHAGDIVAWGRAGILGRVFRLWGLGAIRGCESDLGDTLGMGMCESIAR